MISLLPFKPSNLLSRSFFDLSLGQKTVLNDYAPLLGHSHLGYLDNAQTLTINAMEEKQTFFFHAHPARVKIARGRKVVRKTHPVVGGGVS